MKPLTWEGWKVHGLFVKKGEKATGRNAQGKATFTREQVDDGLDHRAEPEGENDDFTL